MRTKEQIYAEMAPLHAELEAIETREKREAHSKILGKCYRYRNSYGADRGEWWMYLRVTGGDGYWPTVFTFQETADNEIIIKTKESYVGIHHGEANGYYEISRKEFDRQWKRMQTKIAKMQPVVK